MRCTAVTKAVADGFARELEQFGALSFGQGGGGFVVDAQIELHAAPGGKFIEHCAHRGGEVGGSQVVGSEAGNVSADVANAAVQRFTGTIETTFDFGGVGAGDGARGFERESGRVERLDKTVVQVAPEPNFFLKRTIQQALFLEGIGFGALADVAFAGKFARLRDRVFGEPGERVDFGASGGERRIGSAAATCAKGEAGEQTGAEDE